MKPSRRQDTTFRLYDGHYCLVGGRTFGPWPDKGAALAGLATEQIRAKRKQVKRKHKVGK